MGSGPSLTFPQRIVCLTEETVEVLYRLGEQDRIVGVSGFATRPPEVRQKPRVSTFTGANYDAILELKPDLVLTFSDVQAEISKQLALRGVTVLNFNQRSIAEILQMILTLSRIIGKAEAGEALVAELKSGLKAIEDSARSFPRRPRVYFEEWDEPLISGIRWVDELLEIAGGQPIFPELRNRPKARDRSVDAAEVAARDPEVILAAWCGKKVRTEKICARPGWSNVSAVQQGFVYELNSTYILQPGPAALTEAVRQIHSILARVVGVPVDSRLQPDERVGEDLLRA